VTVSNLKLLFSVAELTTTIDEEVGNIAGECNYLVDILVRDEPSLALTVGAGGSIKQTIVEDMHDPRIWDVASAKLINVQLVNSAAFELITGLATPKTPVTYKTYLSAGLPFYDIYKEQPSTLSGAFSKVKTISQIDAAQEETTKIGFDPLKPRLCSQCSVVYVDCV
jgi:hypothetical protein